MRFPVSGARSALRSPATLGPPSRAVSSVRGFAVALLFGMFACLTACSDNTLPPPIAGMEQFPEVLAAGLMDGRPVSVASHGGKSLVVNFWATWCEPCRREMESLEALSRKMRSQDLVVVGINVDTDVNLAREFVLKHGLSFPNHSDPDMALARDRLGIGALPATLVVAPDGRIAARVIGPRDWASDDSLAFLRNALTAHLPPS